MEFWPRTVIRSAAPGPAPTKLTNPVGMIENQGNMTRYMTYDKFRLCPTSTIAHVMPLPMSVVETAKLTKNEHLKQRIPTLAGNIAATLADPALEKFSEDDEQFIKFHGI